MKEIKSQSKVDKPDKNDTLLSITTGVVSGLINGIFGGGGGMIVVPMLIYLLKFKPKVAHATAILIILPFSIVSGLLYASFGNLNWSIGLPTTLGVVGGGVIGAFLLKKLSAVWVTVLFSVVMAAAGIRMLFF